MTKSVFITHPLFGPGPSTPASPEWAHNWAAPALNFQRYLRMVAWAVGEVEDGGAGVAVISWAHHWLIHTQGLIPASGSQGADLYVKRDQALLRHAEELWVGGGPEAADLSSGTRAMITAAGDLGIPVFSVLSEGDTYKVVPFPEEWTWCDHDFQDIPGSGLMCALCGAQ